MCNVDSLTAARHRAKAAWIVPALIGTFVAGSLAFAAMPVGALNGVPAALDADGTTAVSADAAGAGAGGAAAADDALAAIAPGAAKALQASGAASAGVSGPLSASVDFSPFYPNGDGVRDRTSLTAVLSTPAKLSVVVEDFDGKTIRTLANGVTAAAGSSVWRWNGTNARNKLVADGAYRFHVTAVTTAGTFSLDRWVAKDKLIPYPVDPQAIVVAIDSGHGGPDPGAYYRKVRESNLNLDIALRLQDMLQSSGIQVVMTRTTDTAVNNPPVDVGGDGKVTHGDELLIRNDIANLARADLHVVLMNNAYGCHCAHGTETYTSGDRSWTPEGVDLAHDIQVAHIARLKPFATKAWKPNDRGVKLWDYASMRPYKPNVMPRPDLMPSVLVESLFMDHPNELKELTTPAVRAALATAYYDGIVRWLAKRAYGLRYDVLSASSGVQTGGTAAYSMRLTNRGNQASSGWILEARMVSAVSGQPYDGSPVRGTLIAQTSIPNGLKPGQAVTVSLAGVPVPTVAGNYLVKFDVRLPSGDTLQDHGVVGPQLPLTATAPPPPATPSPAPLVTEPPSPPPLVTEPPTPAPLVTEPPTPAPLVTEPPTPAPLITEPPTAEPSATPTPEGTAELSQEPTITADPGSSAPADSSVGSGAEPADASTIDANISTTIAVAPRLFGRPLPFDPEQGRPGAGGTFSWSVQQPWRRYITPIDIRPDSAMGQAGLDTNGR